jgi:hypothetical protein
VPEPSGDEDGVDEFGSEVDKKLSEFFSKKNI